AERGFTITGDEQFLEPLTLVDSNLPPRFEHLTDIAKDDALMLKRMVELRAQTELSLNFHRQVVAARRTQNAKAAAQLVSGGEGKRIMDAIRARIGELGAMRANLVSDQGAGARARLLRASLTSVVAGVVGIGAGVFAFWLAR